MHAWLVAGTLVLGVSNAGGANAQAAGPKARVSGTVIDETGGVMQAVRVQLFGTDAPGPEPVAATTTTREGRFVLEVPSGPYRLRVSAPVFETVELTVDAAPGMAPLEVTLVLEPMQETVDVGVDPADELRLDALGGLTATTLSDDELLALPTDEQDLVDYLLLLAGADATGDTDADASGFIIDGFDGGRLPDPEEIARIIIDPTPLRVDGSGEGPRIEIITRPGTGRWRRSLDVDFADESLDATTPGERTKPARQTRHLDVDLRGPVVADLIDVDVEASTSSQERAAESIIAITPTANVSEAVVRPETGHELELDTDIALSPTRTLGIDVDYERERRDNSGVGGFTLPERGVNQDRHQWSFQVSERRLGDGVANDFRVRVDRAVARETPLTGDVAIDVADAFNRGGGTRRSLERDTRLRIENRLRWQRGDWSLQTGVEGRYERRYSLSEDNYNGTFDFAHLHDYCLATDLVGVNCAPTNALVETARARGVAPAFTDARGEAVAITGLPTTYSVTVGDGELDLTELAVEGFLQADRGFGDRATVRLGTRYEATNHSEDFLRLNSTVNLQYRLHEHTVVSIGTRLGFQDFERYETLIRNDASARQRRVAMSAPAFPDPFAGGAVTIEENRQSVFILDDRYRAPYSHTPQVSLTQQLPGSVRLHVAFRASYGYRQERTRNINAPAPGTPLAEAVLDLPAELRQDAIDRMRPFYPNVGNIYRIETTGRSVSRRLRVRIQRRRYLEIGAFGVSGSASYSYRWGEDDDDFNNPYRPTWGLSRRNHDLWSQLRFRLPREVGATHPVLRALARATYEDTTLNLTLRAHAGRPYSLRSGRDLNGDQSTRDRPPGVARNSETGPGRVNLDLTWTKYFRAGDQPRGDRGRTGRSVRLQARATNVLNTSQTRAYSGVLSSPLFGRATGWYRGRTVRVSMRVDF